MCRRIVSGKEIWDSIFRDASDLLYFSFVFTDLITVDLVDDLFVLHLVFGEGRRMIDFNEAYAHAHAQ